MGDIFRKHDNCHVNLIKVVLNLSKLKIMKYPISVLQNQIVKHFQEITKLENVDHEMVYSMIFTDEEIQNHKDCILQLQIAINKLI